MIESTALLQRFAEGPHAVLTSAISGTLDWLSDHPEAVRHLEDHELLALAAWTGDDPYPVPGTLAIRREGKRRHDYHAQQERRWAEFETDLTLIADLPGDMPWEDASDILNRRAKAIVNKHIGDASGDC